MSAIIDQRPWSGLVLLTTADSKLNSNSVEFMSSWDITELRAWNFRGLKFQSSKILSTSEVNQLRLLYLCKL